MKKYSSILFPDSKSIDVVSGNCIEFIFGKQLNDSGEATLIIKDNDEMVQEFSFFSEEQLDAIVGELYNLKTLLKYAKTNRPEEAEA